MINISCTCRPVEHLHSFSKMFYILNHKKPLTSFCYSNMFTQCTCTVHVDQPMLHDKTIQCSILSFYHFWYTPSACCVIFVNKLEKYCTSSMSVSPTCWCVSQATPSFQASASPQSQNPPPPEVFICKLKPENNKLPQIQYANKKAQFHNVTGIELGGLISLSLTFFVFFFSFFLFFLHNYRSSILHENTAAI